MDFTRNVDLYTLQGYSTGPMVECVEMAPSSEVPKAPCPSLRHEPQEALSGGFAGETTVPTGLQVVSREQ